MLRKEAGCQSVRSQEDTPSFPRRREFIVPLPQRPKKYSVIPAKAGIHNSRACGNLTKTENGNTVQTDQYTLFPRKTTTSFPRRTTTSFPHGHSRIHSIRHSREGGNSSSHCLNARKNTPSFPRRRESTIPAHAGMKTENGNTVQTDQHFAGMNGVTSFPHVQ